MELNDTYYELYGIIRVLLELHYRESFRSAATKRLIAAAASLLDIQLDTQNRHDMYLYSVARFLEKEPENSELQRYWKKLRNIYEEEKALLVLAG